MSKFFEYFLKHGDDILLYFLQHIEMCAGSFLISFIIAMALSILLLNVKWLRGPAISILGALYAIPSMAFFAMLVPFFGLGMKDALIVLSVYSQFILVRNIVAGFQAVDKNLIEAGKGMGMNVIQIFLKIQMPLAMPVILSGVRIALVVTIGSTTIAQTVNAGGLGVLVFDGLRTMNYVKMIWGSVLIAALSLSINMVFGRLEKNSLKRAQGYR